MIENETIKHQLNHKTIRKFKDQTLSKEQLTTLYEVARQTSTSMFTQQFSILHITDDQKKKALREISGQPYIGDKGDLFIFLADLYRNVQIRRQQGLDDGRLHTADLYFQATQDAILAMQNMINAAESMGLGVVILGSLNDDPKRYLEVLDLPEMTYPVLALQVGVPDQEPQLKPRLPLEFTTFENEYPRNFKVEALKDYDAKVETYYDLRDTNRRIDSFTKQITGPKLENKHLKRDDIIEALHQQGLALDLN